MTVELSAPIQSMLDATNREDSDAFLACFDEHAVLNDWGREFAGHDAIARWNANENIGVHSRITVTSVTPEGDGVRVGIQVAGDGYNGGGSFLFHTHGGRITRLEIQG